MKTDKATRYQQLAFRLLSLLSRKLPDGMPRTARAIYDASTVAELCASGKRTASDLFESVTRAWQVEETDGATCEATRLELASVMDVVEDLEDTEGEIAARTLLARAQRRAA